MFVFQSVKIVQRGDVTIRWIPFAGNPIDPFTRTLTERVFIGYTNSIGFR